MTQTTHDLDLGPERVTKTFRSRYGDEAAREWGALTVLAQHAPGLAPTPLERHDDAGIAALDQRARAGVGERPIVDRGGPGSARDIDRRADRPISARADISD